MPNFFKTVVVTAVCVCLMAACKTPLVTKAVDVNGARLPYVTQGQGVPVVLVHGALSDSRVWDGHRAALAAQGYQAISYTQRYFGREPWDKGWPPFGTQTSADDLADFVRGLGVGPVHLVGWSYGSHVVFTVALKHPELVRSVFVYEPSRPTYITDPAQLQALGADGMSLAGPAVQAVRAGDAQLAAKRFIDGVAGQPGYFGSLPPPNQEMILDNARTLTFILEKEIVPPISCQQLGLIDRPIAVVRGDRSRPFFRIIAEGAARCVPNGKHAVVAGQHHLWPSEDVDGFTAMLVAFLAPQPR